MKLDVERLLVSAELASGVKRDEILGRRKFKHLITVRFALWYIARHIGLSYPETGYTFGMFDHTAVMNGIRVADRWMQTGDRRSEMIEKIVELYA